MTLVFTIVVRKRDDFDHHQGEIQFIVQIYFVNICQGLR